MSVALLQVIGFTLLILGLSYGVGMLCFMLARIRQRSLLHHAAAPVMGLSALAIQLWIYGLVHIPWNRWLLLAPWIIIVFLMRQVVVATLSKAPATGKRLLQTAKNLDRLSGVLLVVGALLALTYLLRLATEPLLSSDTMAFWSLKAKEFFHHQAVFVDPYLNSSYDIGRFFHVDYPPLWPLMADVSYVLLGHMQEALQKTTTWILCLSAVGAVWAFAKQRFGDANKAVVAAFIMLAAPQFLSNLYGNAHMAYGDYPLAVMMLFSALFLVKSFDAAQPNNSWVLTFLFASLAAVTKNEGIPFLVIIGVIMGGRYILHLYRTRGEQRMVRTTLIATGLAAALLVPNILWFIYKQRHGLAVEFRAGNLADSGMGVFERLTLIGRTAYDYLKGNSIYWWQLLALALGGLAALWRRNVAALTLLVVIAGMLCSYLLSYLFSPHEIGFHVSSSLDRLLGQLLPLIIVLLVAVMTVRSPRAPK